MALSKIDTPAIADAAVTDAKSAVDLSALATTSALSSTQSDLATANATIASLRSDIGSLALQSARADNQAAFNLGNSFVDQFEDATGIDTTTNTQRNAGEFVSSVAQTLQADPDTVAIFSPSSADTGNQQVADEMGSSAFLKKVNVNYGGNSLVAVGPFSGNYSLAASNANNGGWKVSLPTSDFNLSGDMTLEGWARRYGSRTQSSHQYIFDWNGATSGSGDRISWAFHPTYVYVGGAFGSADSHSGTGETQFPLNTWVHWAYVLEGTFLSVFINGSRIKGATVSSTVQSDGLNFSSPEGELAFLQRHGSDATGWNDFTYVSEIRLSSTARYTGTTLTVPTAKFPTQTLVDTTSATGNFTGVTQTATSSVSEMSIVVLYEDNAGTATLNTDITAEVSANNGTDFTTVTLAPAGNFSSNLKLAKSAPVSVTAGTQPKYRINFANQASGSKVTRIQGVALVY